MNAAMLKGIPNSVISLIAYAQKQRASKSIDKLTDDSSRTAGRSKIEIKVGAKIMLLRNIDVTVGLVNGAIGFVAKAITDAFNKNAITHLRVRFDSGEFDLEPIIGKFQLFSNV